jgi:hypothetical protein
MPKPMMIMIMVEELAFGSVYRKIDAMPGVISLSLNANNGDKAPAAPAKTRAKGKTADGSTALCIVLNALHMAHGSAIPRSELRDLIVTQGKAPKSLANVIFTGRRKKLMKTTKDGLVILPAGDKYLKTECAISGRPFS